MQTSPPSRCLTDTRTLRAGQKHSWDKVASIAHSQWWLNLLKRPHSTASSRINSSSKLLSVAQLCPTSTRALASPISTVHPLQVERSRALLDLHHLDSNNSSRAMLWEGVKVLSNLCLAHRPKATRHLEGSLSKALNKVLAASWTKINPRTRWGNSRQFSTGRQPSVSSRTTRSSQQDPSNRKEWCNSNLLKLQICLDSRAGLCSLWITRISRAQDNSRKLPCSVNNSNKQGQSSGNKRRWYRGKIKSSSHSYSRCRIWCSAHLGSQQPSSPKLHNLSLRALLLWCRQICSRAPKITCSDQMAWLRLHRSLANKLQICSLKITAWSRSKGSPYSPSSRCSNSNRLRLAWLLSNSRCNSKCSRTIPMVCSSSWPRDRKKLDQRLKKSSECSSKKLPSKLNNINLRRILQLGGIWCKAAWALSMTSMLHLQSLLSCWIWTSRTMKLVRWQSSAPSTNSKKS